MEPRGKEHEVKTHKGWRRKVKSIYDATASALIFYSAILEHPHKAN